MSIQQGIRSYMRRRGRMTPAQAAMLTSERYARTVFDDVWLEGRSCWCPAEVLDGASKDAYVVCDVGFGMGETLLHGAQQRPDGYMLGVEVYEPGVAAALVKLEHAGCDNVAVMATDAVNVLAKVAPSSFDRVQVFFADPWPKKRHHKRRLVQAAFMHQVVTALKPGGMLHLATDWAPYADWMLDVLAGEPRLVSQAPPGQRFCERPPERPRTKYERRGERLGHAVFDLLYAKTVQR